MIALLTWRAVQLWNVMALLAWQRLMGSRCCSSSSNIQRGGLRKGIDVTPTLRFRLTTTLLSRALTWRLIVDNLEAILLKQEC